MVDEAKKDDVVVDDTTIENDDTPEETIFDAVSDAIDENTVGLDTGDADDDAPTGDKDDVTPTPKAADDKEKDAENEGSDDTPKPDEPTDGEGDADTPEAGKEAVPGADEPAAKDADTPADADGKDKEPDHVNDPIPKELAEKTQDRIRSLAERTKVAEAAVTERTTELDEMITMVQDTGTSGEQYGQVLGFMKLFNSDNETDQRAAYEVMKAEVAAMAAKLGEPLAGADPLEGHADLQAEIEAGTLTNERAVEISNTRAREKASALRTETGNTDAAAQNAIEQAVVDGKAALADYEQSKAKDPQWAAKKAILVPALRAVMRTIHPSLWKSTFEESYDKLVLAPTVATPKPKVPTPLRPKAPAGEGSKEPSTMAEAIELSLGGSIDD